MSLLGKTLTTLALTAGMAAGAVSALACSCLQRPIADHFLFADAVFVGNVEAVQQDLGTDDVHATLTVSRAYKGALDKQVSVATWTSSAACGVEFAVGTEYLVWAETNADGELVASLCTRTQRLADAGADVLWLEAQGR